MLSGIVVLIGCVVDDHGLVSDASELVHVGQGGQVPRVEADVSVGKFEAVPLVYRVTVVAWVVEVSLGFDGAVEVVELPRLRAVVQSQIEDSGQLVDDIVV